MNKKFLGLIFAFVFVLLPLKSVLALVNITPVIVEPRTVTLIAKGLTNSCYDFILYDLKDSVAVNPPQIQKQNVCKKEAYEDFRITFSNLRPGNEYLIKFNELGNGYESRFMTAYNDSNLNGIIRVVSERLDKPIVEGTTPGQYIVGSKAKLQTALTYAEDINGNISMWTQSDIDVAARDLQNALNTFELSKVPATSNSTTQKTSNKDTENIEKNGIVPRCNNLADGLDEVTGQYKVPCDFNFFMELINNVIKFLLFVIATPLIALILMYTGYLYLTAGGNSGQVEKVRHILLNAVVGYVIALAAWLIVNTIISVVKIDPTINTFMEKIDK